MSKEYSLPLDEAQVFFFAEMIALMYCSVVRRACLMSMCSEAPFAPVFLETALRENLRALLREPLRNPFFRGKFTEYFQRHEHEDVREVAWAWMEEVLVWES
ncbi:hypothetical protein KGQ72_00400 [Patescibacteria group bacterium]|nr:hypothetical protein [Patescibacteria group bacterium]